MGIKGLAKLLSDEAPDSIREVELKSLHGRKIAIDASMAIYQFLIAVRSSGNFGGGGAATMLTNDAGETTSHIQGMFNRTIRYMTEGIKPAFVFDGKPPQLKSGELMKRREKREKAEMALQAAEEEGNVEEQDKQSKRLVRAGHKENEDCRKLLRLMGVPVIMAPCEAEAQACALALDGLVYAVGTEDMDALTFKAPVLLRKMTFANASKSSVQQLSYPKALEGLEITHDQFVDLCILLGCDYCDTIRGVGPKTALKLIRQHTNIETILQNIDRKKHVVPDNWIPGEEYNTDDENRNQEATEEKPEPAYVAARRLFNQHEVLGKEEAKTELKWKPCQEEELKTFLVSEMGFNEERVAANIEKLKKAYEKNTKPQARLDSFFTVKANPNAAKIAAKRKAEAQKQQKENKKKKGASRRR